MIIFHICTATGFLIFSPDTVVRPGKWGGPLTKRVDSAPKEGPRAKIAEL